MFGIFGGRKSELAVARKAWADTQADLRALKRLVNLQASEAREQARRFAEALDVLDRRTQELLALQGAALQKAPASLPDAPTLASVAAAAPEPDIEKMRAFYARKRAEKEEREAQEAREAVSLEDPSMPEMIEESMRAVREESSS